MTETDHNLRRFLSTRRHFSGEAISVFSLIWLLASISGTVTGDEADRVTNLPGQPPVSFRQYAGYVNLPGPAGKRLFYWFFQAEQDPENKPLVLWLHGGPGCSSVSLGAAQELGPFLVESDGITLAVNPFSWNKVANMLFLESPVGVGFSYANDSETYKNIGDRVIATDSYEFLVGWLKKFPTYRSRPFFITGESYAGHYAPQVAEVIYEKNKKASEDSYIPLQGVMVGNAVLNDPTDSLGMVEYAWSHGLISDRLHSSIIQECKFIENYNTTASCEKQFGKFFRAFYYINPYGIHCPVGEEPRHHSKLDGRDPCEDGHMMEYFNRVEVQKALHANTDLPYPYTVCSMLIDDWRDSPESVLPTINKLLNVGVRFWVYSGDADARVPFTSTRLSLNILGLEIEEEWRPWFYEGRVAGWTERYHGGLTFATLRGAGHQVPRFTPGPALSLLENFIAARPLDVQAYNAK